MDHLDAPGSLVTLPAMNARLGRMVTALMFAALAGCGSSVGKNGDRECPAYSPCGGNIVGTWVIRDYCAQGDPGFGSKECDVTSWEHERATGTMTFNADLTYSMDITSTVTFVLDAPLSCGSGSGGGSFDEPPDGGASVSPSRAPTCAEIEQGQQAYAAMNPNFAATVSCTGSNNRCACTRVSRPSTHMSKGSYSTRETKLSMNGSDHGRYCVKGNELFLFEADPGSVASSSASSRLVRQ
jgi:hypothetical protein